MAVKSMNDKVKIKGEMISQYIIDLLNGERGKKTIDNKFFIVAKAMQRPLDLPFLIEDIYALKNYKYADDLRFALVRVQIYCDMHMNKDMEHYQRLNYVAETIENILFGELMKEGVDLDEEEGEGEKRRKAEPKKKAGKAKKK
jgi:hypothetical protein